MPAEPVGDHRVSSNRAWRDAVATARFFGTGVDRHRGVAISTFTVATAAMSGGDRPAFHADGA